ncbi:hypothetical protein LTA6_000209 [Microbacterium sp. LTA6]|uniref:hypothetical protein n=1 Tax=unclassified Microbacterium TaxID=2609290 RepID=UPI003138AAFF
MDDWMSRLHSAPFGPTTTLARNFAAGVSAIAGLVCLVVPFLQMVPLPSVLLASIAGLGFFAASLITALRWKPLVRRAAREAVAAGATSSFAFTQAEFSKGAAKESEYVGSGWVLILGERLDVCVGPNALGVGEGAAPRAIRQDEIVRVSRREPTSMSYAMLTIALASGDEVSFTLTPRNGSGLRGPSDSEVDDAITSIRSVTEDDPWNRG